MHVDKTQTNKTSIQKRIVNKRDSDEEENVILERDQISSLVCSKSSLRNIHSNDIHLENLEMHTTKENEENKQVEESEREPSKLIAQLKLIRGPSLALYSAIISSLLAIIAKKANSINPFEQVFCRYLVQLIVMISIACIQHVNIRDSKGQAKLLIARGFIGAFGLIFSHFAIYLLNPSDANAISQTNVIVTVLLSRLILNERLTLAHLFALVLTIIGVVFITQPSFVFKDKNNFLYGEFNHSAYLNNSYSSMSWNRKIANDLSIDDLRKKHSLFYIMGLFIAFLDALSLSFIQIIVKNLCMNKVHYVHINLIVSFIGLVLCTPFASIMLARRLFFYNGSNHQKPTFVPLHLLYILFSGLLGSLGQIFTYLSLKYEDASKVAVIKTSNLFFIFVLQYFLLDIVTNFYSMIGAALIVSSTIIIFAFKFLDEWLQSTDNKSKNSSCKRYCFYKF
jgi:drug/metabolite transporter (DMT)-like permease